MIFRLYLGKMHILEGFFLLFFFFFFFGGGRQYWLLAVGNRRAMYQSRRSTTYLIRSQATNMSSFPARTRLLDKVLYELAEMAF